MSFSAKSLNNSNVHHSLRCGGHHSLQYIHTASCFRSGRGTMKRMIFLIDSFGILIGVRRDSESIGVVMNHWGNVKDFPIFRIDLVGGPHPAMAVHRDPHPGVLQNADELRAGELAFLVRCVILFTCRSIQTHFFIIYDSNPFHRPDHCLLCEISYHPQERKRVFPIEPCTFLDTLE